MNILLAHDYFGPEGPRSNNRVFFDCDVISLAYFKMLGGFERWPSSLLSEYTSFIYEIFLSFKEEEWIKNDYIDLLGTTSITDKILDSIKHRRGYLLLNLGTESVIEKDFYIFDKVHAFCKEENIKLSKVILQLGNPAAPELYKDYCFKHGITGGEDGTELLNICPIEYFEFHTSFVMSESIKPRKNIDFNAVEKTFLCFNRNYRFHRVNLIMLFHKLNLLKDSYFSMPENHVWKEEERFKDTRYIHPYYREKYNISMGDIDDVQDMLPLTVDTPDFFDDMAIHYIWEALSPYYDKTLISLVTETNFEEGIFNTEKIFRPMANRHPFILVGPKGTLAHLKELGYKTFSDYWDESYDDIEDPIERLDTIVNLCDSINNWSAKEKRIFFYKSMKETTHNYNLLESIAKENTFKRNEFWHYFKNLIRDKN